jgi:hypothetical protein
MQTTPEIHAETPEARPGRQARSSGAAGRPARRLPKSFYQSGGTRSHSPTGCQLSSRLRPRPLANRAAPQAKQLPGDRRVPVSAHSLVYRLDAFTPPAELGPPTLPASFTLCEIPATGLRSGPLRSPDAIGSNHPVELTHTVELARHWVHDDIPCCTNQSSDLLVMSS